ncbi:MAG: hypothetical protein DRI32_07920, partial [Chloroflexi bacterium]
RLKRTAAVKKVDDLLQGLKALYIHDDFHPFIMNVFLSVVQTHLMLETRDLLQTHLILEEAKICIPAYFL